MYMPWMKRAGVHAMQNELRGQKLLPKALLLTLNTLEDAKNERTGGSPRSTVFGGGGPRIYMPYSCTPIQCRHQLYNADICLMLSLLHQDSLQALSNWHSVGRGGGVGPPPWGFNWAPGVPAMDDSRATWSHVRFKQ
jgi:hypothetical protein